MSSAMISKPHPSLRQCLAAALLVASAYAVGCSTAGAAPEFGVGCDRAADCASNVCLPVEAGRRVCTTQCVASADCAEGWRCGEFGGVTESVCVCDASPEACDGDDDDCDGLVDEDCGAVSSEEPRDPVTPGDEPTPGSEPEESEPSVDPCLATVVDASTQSSCAVGMDGTLYCWGGVVWSNADYDLGYWALAPEPMIVGEEITAVSDGGLHFCALTADDRLLCRGGNEHGQLGIGTRRDTDVATEVPGRFREVAAGYIHTCGIMSDGSLHCWGFGNDGALGTGDLDDRTSPTRVGAAADWESVSAGRFGTCALRNGGQIHCWGTNAPPLGDGAVQRPRRLGTGDGFQKVDVGTNSGCAVDAAGALYCWGYNFHGELGLGDREHRDSPARVGGDGGWSDVAVGAEHACGIRDGAIYCWGANDKGQLGLARAGEADALTPQAVGVSGPFVSIHAQGDHTCAVREGGHLLCWGENRSAESGGGDIAIVDAPRELCATDWS